MTSIIEGVIQRGTATSLKSLDRPLAGKTGTTNEEKDAWFIGYTPDLVVGVFVGYDTPTPMGKGKTGGRVAAPVFGDFMKVALADKPPAPFRIPPGLKLVRVDLRTGLRAGADDPQGIMEAFKPDEEPDDAYSVIGFTGTAQAAGRPSSRIRRPAPSGPPTSDRAAAASGNGPKLMRDALCRPRSAFTAAAPLTISTGQNPKFALPWEATMRAEPQKLVESIKEALVLLRRHL